MTSQILHLRNRVIHVPSVASFQLRTTSFLNRPKLSIKYHNGSYETIVYGMSLLVSWSDAKEDACRLQTALDAIRHALSGIPMYEKIKKVIEVKEQK